MFFYLVISYKSLICKLGITRRLPICRLTEYSTFDITSDYYAIAYFPDITLEQLLLIEKNCLSATKQWALCLDRNPNSESRYEVAPDILWLLCEKYFPSSVVIYKSRNKIITLTIEDCPSALETESKETEFFADRKHFSSVEELNSFVPIEMFDDRSNDRSTYNDSSTYNPITLRGYQIEAYEKMTQILNRQAKCTLSIMCRCGKTELFKKYAYHNKDKFNIIIYVAPRLPLITDMIDRFEHMLKKFKYVEISSNRQSKYNITDDQLNKFLNENIPLLIFICNDSFTRLEKVFNKSLNKLIIFDEAHHLAVKKSDEHPLVLLNKWTNIEGVAQMKTEIIFATATPIYGNQYINKEYIVMNDKEYFGDHNTNTISFNDISQAIEQKFMTNAVLVIGKDNNERKEAKEEKRDSKHNTIRIYNAIDILKDVCKQSPRIKVLFYCSRIATVILCYNILLQAMPTFTIFKLDSKMSSEDKTSSLANFKACKTPCILVNCQMVTDGINIHDLDTVVYVDPKYAKTDLIQSSMRPRSYDNNQQNKIAYIIIPQIEDTEDAFTTAITIIKELHISNDPTVVKFVNHCCKKTKTPLEQKETVISNGIIISNDLKSKIIQLTKEALMIKTNMTMPEAILHVLSDGIPRNAKKIWEVIEEKKIFTTSGLTPEASCSAGCSTMARQGKLSVINERPKLYYIAPKLIKQVWSLGRFVQELQDMNIESEIMYRITFQNSYSNEFPVNPTDVYKEFKWELLLNSYLKYYESKELCELAIYRLLKNKEVGEKISSIYSPAEMIEYLRDLDGKIPPYNGIKKIYGIEPNLLHNILNNNYSDLE